MDLKVLHLNIHCKIKPISSQSFIIVHDEIGRERDKEISQNWFSMGKESLTVGRHRQRRLESDGGRSTMSSMALPNVVAKLQTGRERFYVDGNQDVM